VVVDGVGVVGVADVDVVVGNARAGHVVIDVGDVIMYDVDDVGVGVGGGGGVMIT